MKTWDKGTQKDKLDKKVLKFLSKEDIEMDKKLVKWEILSTISHVFTLENSGIINQDEKKKVLNELMKMYNDGISLNLDQEDMHSNIEFALIDKLGDAGKKVYTATSRNEKVITSTKLYMKSEILEILNKALDLTKNLIKLSEKHRDVVIPGYTHHQQAMPYTFGSMTMAYFYSLMDDIESLIGAYNIINKNPLGSGAGFGVPLEIDKKVTENVLGFNKTEYNSLYHINSRGKNELFILSSLTQLLLDLSRISEDLIIFSMKEFNFVEIPSEYATGSSIMPQKKNPDVLEVIKGKSATVTANMMQTLIAMKNLPSGYHRDLQETKKSIISSVDITKDCLDMMTGIIEKLKINEDTIRKSISDDIFSTHHALEIAQEKKIPYKEAYAIVGEKIKKGGKIKEFIIKPDFGEYNTIYKNKANEVNEMKSEFNSKILDLIEKAKL